MSNQIWTTPISLIPEEYKTKIITYNGETRSWEDVLKDNPDYEVYTDINGKPITLAQYNKYKQVQNQDMLAPGIKPKPEISPEDRYRAYDQAAMANPANPYNATLGWIGANASIIPLAISGAVAPVATGLGVAGDFLGQYIGNKISDNLFKNPDKPLKLNVDLSPTPRQIMQYGTGFVLGGLMGIDAGINPALRQSLSRYSRNVLKRGVETAMRTSADADPIPKINKGLEEYYNTKIPGTLKQVPRFLGNLAKSSITNPRARAITKYILTGKGKGNGYNTLSIEEVVNPFTGVKEPYKYSGLYDNENFYPSAGYGDVIDAYLYRTPLDPRIGLKDTEGLGIFDSDIPKDMPFYVSRNYSKVSENIPSYTLNSEPETSFIPKELQQTVKIKSNVASTSASIFNRQSIPLNLQSKSGFSKGFNSGGHRISLGELPNGTRVFRREDIWKFNPEDYINRWGTDSQLAKWGLKTVNELGTPIITRTPWMLLGM